MARFLGVKIEHADKRFTKLIEVGSATSGRSRLTTLTPQQDIAEIEIYLLRHGVNTSQSPSEIRRLYRFTRRHTSRNNETRPLFELSARRRGRRRYEIQLHEDGILQETVAVRVPRSRGAIAAFAVLLLALIGVGIGVRTLLTPGEPTRPARSVTSERAATPERSTTETAQRTDRESDTVARRPESPQSGTGNDSQSTGTARAEADHDEVDAEASTGTTTPQATTSSPNAVADPPSQDRPVEAIEPEAQNETIYFLPDSIQLTRDAARTLDAFLGRIEGAEIIEIRVEGHTALYGNEAGRERISRGRISAVLSYLENSGWRPETLPETEALGAQAPVTRATDQQHLNRRAEIHVTYRPDVR